MPGLLLRTIWFLYLRNNPAAELINISGCNLEVAIVHTSYFDCVMKATR